MCFVTPILGSLQAHHEQSTAGVQPRMRRSSREPMNGTMQFEPLGHLRVGQRRGVLSYRNEMRCGRRRAKGIGHQPSACTAQGCNWAQQNEIGGTTRRPWWDGAYQAGPADAIMDEIALGTAAFTAIVVSSLARFRSIPGGRESAFEAVPSGPEASVGVHPPPDVSPCRSIL